MYAFDNLPAVPLTLEGASVLHQMLRVRWPEWRAQPAGNRAAILKDAAGALQALEGQGSALFSLLGHKGDLMLVHFRDSFEALAAVEHTLTRLHLWDFFELTTSYVSVVELGLYESSSKTYSSLAERNIEPHTPEWNKEIEETLARQRQAMQPRLFPEMPATKYACFYPLDPRRVDQTNRYPLP